jgi:hypothetical protein
MHASTVVEMASINAAQALVVEQLSSHILRLDSGNHQQVHMIKSGSYCKQY